MTERVQGKVAAMTNGATSIGVAMAAKLLDEEAVPFCQQATRSSSSKLEGRYV